MSETKRVSDQYKISSPTIIIDGNLTVLGSTTSVETVNSTINDNIIVLNSGETGAGVTGVTAGIEIERGTLANTKLLYNESSDVWEFSVGGLFAVVRGADPVADDDFVTKRYVDIAAGALPPGGPINAVQYNLGGAFGGSSRLIFDGDELLVDNLSITGSSVSNRVTNLDLQLDANGTGKIYLKAAIKLDNETVDPTSQAGTNIVFAKTPSTAGSGLFFTNSNTSDELVSRKKAILFGLIF